MILHWHLREVLHLFRKPPAALAVYITYTLRGNEDNIAWPSLRGMVDRTGWSLPAVHEARRFLVNNHALKRIPNYVPPGWRDKPQAELTQLLNLDQSEYYKVTHFIIIDGVRYSLILLPDLDPKSDSMYNPAIHQSRYTCSKNTQKIDTVVTKDSKDSATKKVAGKPKPKGQRKKDEHFEILCKLFGFVWRDDQLVPGVKLMTEQEASNVRGVVKQLKDSGYSPDDIEYIFGWCTNQGWSSFGPNALSGNASNAMKASRANQQPTDRKGFEER